MKRPLELRRVWPLMLLFTAMGIGAQEEPAFDASQFEKKPFELGGYVQLKQESFSLNRSAAFYKLGFYNQPQRESLDRTTETLQLAGKVRQGIGTFDFRA